jgi:hypothetical protein
MPEDDRPIQIPSLISRVKSGWIILRDAEVALPKYGRGIVLPFVALRCQRTNCNRRYCPRDISSVSPQRNASNEMLIYLLHQENMGVLRWNTGN